MALLHCPQIQLTFFFFEIWCLGNFYSLINFNTESLLHCFLDIHSSRFYFRVNVSVKILICISYKEIHHDEK